VIVRVCWLVGLFVCIDGQPHIAGISWERLHLRYRADATRLILMDGNSRQTDSPRTRPLPRLRRGSASMQVAG